MAAVTSVVLYDPRDTSPDVRTIAGFLAGYSGRTREAYTLDLRMFYRWCDEHQLALFDITRTHIELYARELAAGGLDLEPNDHHGDDGVVRDHSSFPSDRLLAFVLRRWGRCSVEVAGGCRPDDPSEDHGEDNAPENDRSQSLAARARLARHPTHHGADAAE